MAKDKKLDAKTAWEKYHKLRAKADAALKKLADFSCWKLGRGHLADGFTDDMNENYLYLKKSSMKNLVQIQTQKMKMMTKIMMNNVMTVIENY